MVAAANATTTRMGAHLDRRELIHTLSCIRLQIVAAEAVSNLGGH
jgi:hypothetical protein